MVHSLIFLKDLVLAEYRDSQTKTSAGDIVLYNSNSVVMFYGSNSWAYTRLGRITDKSADEMAALLGNGNVTVTVFLD